MSTVRDRVSERLTRERLGLEVKRARVPFLVWLALIAASVLAFVLLLHELHLPAPWASRYSIRVAASEVTGVQSGDAVRIAGVEVGRVTSIALSGDAPVLGLSIDPQYGPLYRDARLEVRPSTPLENMYVDIVSRGTRAAGAVPGGGELTAAQTASPVQIGQVIDIFDASVRPRVTATIDALGQGLGDHGVQLRAALVELAPFLRVAQQFSRATAIRQVETRRLVHNFALLSGELASRTTQLKGLVRDGATTMGRLASVEHPLGALIDQLPPTLRELPASLTTVDAASSELTPAARSLVPVAGALAPALSALKRFSPAATTALAALNRPLPGLTGLLRQARPLASQLGRAFALLRPQAPELGRVTAAIIPCETAVQNFFQWTLSVSKLSGLHGDMQRGVLVASPQSLTGLVAPTINTEQGLLSTAPTCSGVPAGP